MAEFIRVYKEVREQTEPKRYYLWINTRLIERIVENGDNPFCILTTDCTKYFIDSRDVLNTELLLKYLIQTNKMI